MESFYRKYRPWKLSEVTGQKNVVHSLSQQAVSGRYAQSYQFSGHRGAGKTSVARILASLLNCEKRGTDAQAPLTDMSCCQCRACQLIHEGTCPDVYEIDGASNNGVDEARSVKERSYFTPQEFRYKIFIIDECHMLTTQAWNSLLKVVEEPPDYVKFIFCTTNHAKVLPTIVSRSRQYLFQGLGAPDIASRVSYVAAQEKIDLEAAAAAGIARLADGSLRDALNYLEEAGISSSNKVTVKVLQDLFGQPERRLAMELVKLIADGNSSAVLMAADDLIRHGADVHSVLIEVSEVFRDVMVLEAGADALLVASPEEKEILAILSKKLTRRCLVNIAKLLGRIDREINLNINPRMILEAALLHCISYVATDAAKHRPQA